MTANFLTMVLFAASLVASGVGQADAKYATIKQTEIGQSAKTPNFVVATKKKRIIRNSLPDVVKIPAPPAPYVPTPYPN